MKERGTNSCAQFLLTPAHMVGFVQYAVKCLVLQICESNLLQFSKVLVNIEQATVKISNILINTTQIQSVNRILNEGSLSNGTVCEKAGVTCS